MVKIIGQTLGIMTEVVQADGTVWPEDNWRPGYVGVPGIIVLCEGLHDFPNERYIHFEMLFNQMRTGIGEIKEDNMKLVIVTRNSRYTFQRCSPWFERE